VGIADNDSTFTPDASAVLELKSSSRGVLVPRLTTAQRTALASPAVGLLVYEVDLDYFFYYNGGWQQLGGTASAGSSITDADADTKVQTERAADEDMIRFTTAGVERMQIGDTGMVKIGGNADYTYIVQNVTLRMMGKATTFTDLVAPVNATTRGGSKDPDFNKLFDNGSGSQGVFAFDFDQSIEEELYFMVQMPHSWKIGSDIHPHVHWTAKSNVGATAVRWGLEYTWVNVGATFPNTTIIYGSTPIPIASPVTAGKHSITPLTSISGAGKELSSILVCRVFRDASHAGDTYTSDATLLMIDFHFEEDSFGSNTQYSK
jgi:hypothetical protein